MNTTLNYSVMTAKYDVKKVLLPNHACVKCVDVRLNECVLKEVHVGVLVHSKGSLKTILIHKPTRH